MSGSSPNPRPPWLTPLALFAALCVIAGVLARFWGLGRWPLAIDEYYFAQSVQNLLRSGLPQYPCGGYYVRGLLLQYASAALQLAGLSAELAPRAIAAVSSLLALPAVYLLGRRLGGRDVGLLTVALLAISVWEVEMSRFGRMYAPFQAVFAWYLVFFLRYAVDRERRALAPMLLLSVVGLATWEGGLFLVLTNLLPPFIANPSGRLTARDWVYVATCSLLLIPAYFLTMADLRGLAPQPSLPPDYVEPPDLPSASRLDAAIMPWTTLSMHPVWMVLALVPAVFVVLGVLRTFRLRLPPLATLGLLAVVGCAAVQQFALAAAIIAILCLLDVVRLRDLCNPALQPVRSALGACLIFWVAFGLSTHSWHAPDVSPIHSALLLGYEFVRFPDAVREIAMPWARTVPLLTLGLFVLVAAAVIRACIYPEQTPTLERVLLAVFMILLLAASASHPPRHETRYVYFLYPLLVIFALMTISRVVRMLLGPVRIAAIAAVIVSVAAFALSEDFRPAHLWNINTAAVNFRIGMSGRLAGHYHPRTDVRAAAEWLHAHAVPGQDIVVDAFPGADFYYRGDYYFVTDADPRFEVWSCRLGTIQRWSNLPMLRSYDALAAKVATGRSVWMILETSSLGELAAKIPQQDWTVEWTGRTHDIAVVLLHRPNNAD